MDSCSVKKGLETVRLTVYRQFAMHQFLISLQWPPKVSPAFLFQPTPNPEILSCIQCAHHGIDQGRHCAISRAIAWVRMSMSVLSHLLFRRSS